MMFNLDGIGYFIAICTVVIMGCGYLIGNGLEYLFSHIIWKE